MFVDDDAPVLGVEAGRLGKVRVGAHAGGGDDDVALEHGAGVNVDVGVVDVGHGRRPEEANPVVGQDLCDAIADVIAEPALQWHGLSGDHRGGHAATGETGGRLTADQPATEDPGGQR